MTPLKTMNTEKDDPCAQLKKRFEKHQGKKVAPITNAERIVKNWILHTKMIAKVIGAAETHKHVDKALAEIKYTGVENGEEIIKATLKPEDRKTGKTEKELIEKLCPEDEQNLHNVEEIFFSEGSVNE